MKPKPLTKDKIKIHDGEIAIKYNTSPNYCFLYEDVKSAIEWLLEEIENEYKMYEVQNEEVDTLENLKYREGVCDGLEIAKQLIKKAFAGVLEE